MHFVTQVWQVLSANRKVQQVKSTLVFTTKNKIDRYQTVSQLERGVYMYHLNDCFSHIDILQLLCSGFSLDTRELSVEINQFLLVGYSIIIS